MCPAASPISRKASSPTCSPGTGAYTKFSAGLPEPRHSPKAYFPTAALYLSLVIECYCADEQKDILRDTG